MSRIEQAKQKLDAQVRATMEWHFSPDTGCPFWLRQKDLLGFDPREKVNRFEDLANVFPPFDGDKYLRTVPASDWHPKGFANCPAWSMYMTGGTTGAPKLRWGRIGFGKGRSDWSWDYRRFSNYLPKDGFPEGGSWLYIGPGGPRRLGYGIELLARLRRAGFMKVDMDVAWMKDKKNSCPGAYKDELVSRAIGALKRNKPTSVFCPPILVEAIGERFDWSTSGVLGVFAGGTEMTPEMVRNIAANLFKGRIRFVPAFGNALVGLARPRDIATLEQPIEGQRPYSVIYQSLRPRTIIEVTQPGDPKQLVQYGERGVLVVTTLTKEWFMPRYPERDCGEWVAPTEKYPWPGVAEVGPPDDARATHNPGVY